MTRPWRFSSPVLALPARNVDTDQIIPARFLKTTSKRGLGEHLFHDWRYDAAGEARPGFILNQPRARAAQILLAGDNFGCGSSREHAAWALVQFGFRAVVSTSFADIFRQNALKNSLLPVVVNAGLHRELMAQPAGSEGARLTIDLEQQQLSLPDGRSFGFAIDGFARRCLLEGLDELGYLLKHEAAIRAFEARDPSPFDARRG